MNLADMIGAQRSPAAAAAPKKPAAAVGFASGEVLGEAWHALIGYEKQDAKGKSVPFTPEEVAIVLEPRRAHERALHRHHQQPGAQGGLHL